MNVGILDALLSLLDSICRIFDILCRLACCVTDTPLGILDLLFSISYIFSRLTSRITNTLLGILDSLGGLSDRIGGVSLSISNSFGRVYLCLLQLPSITDTGFGCSAQRLTEAVSGFLPLLERFTNRNIWKRPHRLGGIKQSLLEDLTADTGIDDRVPVLEVNCARSNGLRQLIHR